MKDTVSVTPSCKPWAVNLEEQTIAGLLLNSRTDARNVGNGQIVTNDLKSTMLGKMSPSVPVVLFERIFDGNNGVLFNVAEVLVSEFSAGQPLLGIRVGILEVQVIFAVLVEFGRSNVEGNLDLAFVPRLLDGLTQKLKCFVSTGYVRGETSFVTNVDR